MANPNIKISRDIANDYVYRALSHIDVSVPDPDELKEARKILLELSQYIIHAPIDSDALTRPAISRR